MATIDLNIIVAGAKPIDGIVPHAIYLVKEEGAEYAQMYKANAAGTDVTLFSDSVKTRKDILWRGPDQPDEGSGYALWYDDEGLALYVNLFGEADTWVSAFSIPETLALAGNGTADTAARSDHFHAGVMVADPAW